MNRIECTSEEKKAVRKLESKTNEQKSEREANSVPLLFCLSQSHAWGDNWQLN